MAAQTFMRVIVPPNPFYDPLSLQFTGTINHTSNDTGEKGKKLFATKEARRRKLHKRIVPDHAYEEGMSRNDVERQLHRIEFHRMHHKEVEDMERVLGTGSTFDKRRAYNENYTQLDVLSNLNVSPNK
ncbi:hypothetical protein ACHWQZ_G000076 [Mnemiopsis leidyi]